MISVIVPVYKTEKYISKCIESILSQTCLDFELILIDDGSPDKCGLICDQYAKLDDRVRVIHKLNGGLSAARNTGIGNAHGEYITFVDSDDWVNPHLLEVLLQGIRQGASISVCGFYTVRDGIPKSWRPPSNKYHVVTSIEAVRDMLYTHSMDTSVWGKLFHKSCFDSILFPDGKLYEEVGITYRLFLTQKKVAIITQPLYYYVKHWDSITTSAFNIQHMDMLYFSKEILTFAEEKEPTLIPAAKRRMIYASCYLLKTMGNHYRDYPEYVNEILRIIKQYSKDVLLDSEVSSRDKAAILLLSSGPDLYIKAWSLYSKLTRRHGNA